MREILLVSFVMISIPLFSQIENSTDSLKIFEKVDIEASFPGGEGGWRKYLERNLDPNVPVENGAPVGIYLVVVQFIVDKTGAISDVKAITDFGYGMEQEVVRIVQKGGAWTPASQNNRKVKAYRKQPITFVVEAENFYITMKERYVLYTGTDNTIEINASRVKKEDMEVSLSQGKITLGADDNFHIIVDNPGKAILFIRNKKRNKAIGSVYFVVRKKT